MAGESEGLRVDGSRGEGGGQILRSALTLACVQGRELRMENIRARRSNPGLAPQHLTAVHATAAVCGAELEGDHLGSTRLRFSPRHEPQPGQYRFDVSERSHGGSAGSVTLIAQTLMIPLMRARGESELILEGGTHVPHSPPFHYLKHVYGPWMERVGATWGMELHQWGFYPRGGGRIRIRVAGEGSHWRPGGLIRRERGPLEDIEGISAVANLPESILQRQTDRTRLLLEQNGYEPELGSEQVASPGPGTAVVLWARYGSSRAGFASLGKKGKPAEDVAKEAVEAFLRFDQSGAPVDRFLADQLVLPLAMAGGESVFRAENVTSHLNTMADLVRDCLGARVEIGGGESPIALVRIYPADFSEA